ncbi:MAG: hypothetical protein HY475_01515 [Candidatus Terrybacteria bacterium]|nr:hypothetical protein [Candidatus Terrybacteria bacterium]
MEGSRFALAALGCMTLMASSALLAMLWFVDPAFADTWTLGVFYLSTFVALAGVFAWIFLFLRGNIGRARRPLIYFFPDALRQGALVAALVAASLLLQRTGWLNLGTMAALVTAAFFTEVTFTRKRRVS